LARGFRQALARGAFGEFEIALLGVELVEQVIGGQAGGAVACAVQSKASRSLALDCKALESKRRTAGGASLPKYSSELSPVKRFTRLQRERAAVQLVCRLQDGW
jgi:hypothetical protein